MEGLHSILITDRDGVPVISVANDKVPELATRAGFLATFGMATDQGSKLGLGKNKTIICMYSSYQVIYLTTSKFYNFQTVGNELAIVQVQNGLAIFFKISLARFIF